MQRRNHTVLRIVGITGAFVAFLGIFGVLAIAMMVCGIYWAFEVFFSVGWWASLLIMFGLLVAYVTALSFALELIRGKSE